LGELTLALNAWSRGPLGHVWAWLGTSSATPWLGVIATAVICARLYLAARVARADGAALGHLGRRAASALLAGTLAIAISDPLCSRALKPAFAAPRPCTIGVTTVPEPLPCGSGYAMPSTHASNTAAVAAAVQSPVLGLVSALVGVSRVVDGQHWPSDVVAGWAIGGLLGAAARALTDRLLRAA